VLQEAADPSVPEIQRLRYLGIFSNNLDEFFRVRVAEVRRLISVSKGAPAAGQGAARGDPGEVVALQHDFERVYQVGHGGAAGAAHLHDQRAQLEPNQGEFVQSFFTSTVLPELDPILFVPGSPIPVLNDESLYLAVDITSNGQSASRWSRCPRTG
jgi:polyphosphate kinase